MSVSPRSSMSPKRYSSRTGSSATKKKVPQQLSQKRIPFKPGVQKVKKLATRSPRMSRWTRSLILLQKSSSVLAFCLVSASLVVYSKTVDTQQLWGSQYKKLENLQRHERNLTTVNETLKNDLAQQAENPETGMVPFNPNNTIFLTPAQKRPFKKAAAETTAEDDTITTTPLGY